MTEIEQVLSDLFGIEENVTELTDFRKDLLLDEIDIEELLVAYGDVIGYILTSDSIKKGLNSVNTVKDLMEFGKRQVGPTKRQD